MQGPIVRLSDDAMKRLVEGQLITVRLKDGATLRLVLQFPDRWGEKAKSIFEAVFGK
jgi:hypothetical protein